MEKLYNDLAELERRRAEVLGAIGALQAEINTRRAEVRGNVNLDDLAAAHAEARASLAMLDQDWAALRAGIISARMARGDEPDCPKGTISAWWPFHGPQPTEGGRGEENRIDGL
jgi:hypothetical protein